MSGKERSGLENAEAELLAGARYILTPLAPEHLDDPRVKAFRELLKSLEARPIISDAETHDRSAAYLSHLPQLLSSGLGSLVEEETTGEYLPLEMAAAGFRDMTRLAESPYSVWRDICLTNRENIRAALDAFIQKLEVIKLHLSDRELEGEFEKALQLRQKLRDLG
jgi:prephenate dehydrogenase